MILNGKKKNVQIKWIFSLGVVCLQKGRKRRLCFTRTYRKADIRLYREYLYLSYGSPEERFACMENRIWGKDSRWVDTGAPLYI